MSCTTVYAAFEDGDMVHVGECQNAFRGAMWIWTELGKKYIDGAVSLMNMKPVWDLQRSTRITDTEWYTLMSTFDGCLCPRELMLKVAEALEDFSPETENLVKQAALIREAHSKGARAVAWLQTSVCCSPWEIWDDDGEECRDWNLDRDMDTPLPELSDGKAWLLEARP